ncbi:A24 family peptidase [Microvirga tunisiensis]|uniref:Peptidase n=1 Tax=Microvirga tunisiensis TaxID=2108360 RepID=A0A5N7MCY8_9HYPH|nr:prepilin peptidase [Microvirga tunisiensis]MPR08148.1 peptidase [Microvirga tunisiensis]MPR24139.1 peptidase [Microvirga tunisiensis]
MDQYLTIQFASVAVFVLLMLTAAVSDLLTMTIPNRLTIALAGLGIIFALLQRRPIDEVGSNILVGFATLVVLCVPFYFRWMGGGDVKLIAAIALWLGFSQEFVTFLTLTAIFGGFLTLGLVTLRQIPVPAAILQLEWCDRLYSRQQMIPYGIAIALAAAITVFQTVL